MTALLGRTALVTGAARGIGRALAGRFADRGAEVVLTDVDPTALDETLAALADRGVAAHGYVMDVTDPDSVAVTRRQVVDEVGPPDVLVNNAGTVHGGPFLDVSLREHLDTFDVNTRGIVTVTHAFLPDLIARPQAHLVTIASIAGWVGVPYGTTYASSKWAAVGLSESLRLELRHLGHGHVHVTTVCPGLVDTGLFAGSRTPRLTRYLTADALADRVVRAVENDRVFLLTPGLMKLAPFLRGTLPTRAFDAVLGALGATSSMVTWTGRTSEPARTVAR